MKKGKNVKCYFKISVAVFRACLVYGRAEPRPTVGLYQLIADMLVFLVISNVLWESCAFLNYDQLLIASGPIQCSHWDRCITSRMGFTSSQCSWRGSLLLKIQQIIKDNTSFSGFLTTRTATERRLFILHRRISRQRGVTLANRQVGKNRSFVKHRLCLIEKRFLDELDIF